MLRQGMAELLDRRVPLADLVGSVPERRLAGRLADETESPTRQRAVLEDFGRRLLRDTGSDEVAAAVAGLLAGRGAAAGTLAEEVGLSTRQLHRRCTTAFGYGPATLARILRFQRFVRSASGAMPGAALAALAADAGYADQAHLTRECRAITGETPTVVVASLADTSVEGVADLVRTDDHAAGEPAHEAFRAA
jgi:AraC-like DNA-binding protein